jgi:hypothetical protein
MMESSIAGLGQAEPSFRLKSGGTSAALQGVGKLGFYAAPAAKLLIWQPKNSQGNCLPIYMILLILLVRARSILKRQRVARLSFVE